MVFKDALDSGRFVITSEVAPPKGTNLEKMLHTGMMDFPLDRFHKLGNSALIGAKMFLFSGMDIPEAILARTEHVNLESEADFQDVFVSRLSFIQPSS